MQLDLSGALEAAANRYGKTSIESGLEAERLKMVNVSAAMARQLIEHIREMAETVKKLGPSPLNRADKSVRQEAKL